MSEEDDVAQKFIDILTNIVGRDAVVFMKIRASSDGKIRLRFAFDKNGILGKSEVWFRTSMTETEIRSIITHRLRCAFAYLGRK